MACPICTSPEGSAISDGIRAGAGVLILVSSIVIGAIIRYAIRLWREEQPAPSFAKAAAFAEASADNTGDR
jgi:hypothetical protein